MSLSKIPVEVVEGHVFKYLAWNDLLRLRRVSKECRALVQGFMQSEKGTERAPEISVGLTGSNVSNAYPDFVAFLQMSIPSSKIFVRNYCDNDTYFKVDHATEVNAFLQQYGAGVKHLHLEQLFLHLRPGMTQLLEGLPNLESLRVDNLLMGRSQITSDLVLPQVFRNLQRFRLSMGPWDWYAILSPLLEALNSAVEAGDQWKRIEFDLDPLWTESKSLSATALYRLLVTCAAKNVSIAGVHSSWIDRPTEVLPRPAQRDTWIPCSITSLIVNEESLLMGVMKLDKLQTLEIISPSECVRCWPNWQPGQLPWWSATLTTLTLQVASFARFLDVPGTSAQLFYGWLSGGHPLLALREARLKCDGRCSNAQNDYEFLEQLLLCAPNLKELSLVSWDGPRDSLPRLLPRMRGLEKLSLRHCESFEDAALVGNDAGNPLFLDLTNLRHLSVENSCFRCTTLTASFFAKVLRHMSLTHFSWTENEGCWSYKEHHAWLASLQGGRFAESIEEIKWNGSRLHEMQFEAELRQLGQSFRSYNML